MGIGRVKRRVKEKVVVLVYLYYYYIFGCYFILGICLFIFYLLCRDGEENVIVREKCIGELEWLGYFEVMGIVVYCVGIYERDGGLCGLFFVSGVGV